MSLTEYSDAIVSFVRDHREWAAPIMFLLAFGESIAFISLVLPFYGFLFGALLIGVLLVRPAGLLGRRDVVKV